MPAINYSKLVGPADFKNARDNFVKRNNRVKADMQNALMCAFEHMDKHGDWTTTVAVLLEAGPSFGDNLNVALQEFVLKFTWLGLEGKAWAKDKSKAMDLKGAAETMWWTMERPAKAKPVDFQKLVDALFDKIEAEAAKPEVDRKADINSVVKLVRNRMDALPVPPAPVDMNATFKELSLNDQNAFLAYATSLMQVQALPVADKIAA